MPPITFDVKLQKREWLMLNFKLGYSNKVVLFFTLLTLAMLAGFFFKTYNKEEVYTVPLGLLFIVFVLAGTPISIYRQAMKNFQQSPYIKETMHFSFEQPNIRIRGTSFDIHLHEKNIILIQEMKDWFVLYTENNRGFFIPKRIFSSSVEIDMLRKYLRLMPAKKRLSKQG